MTGPHRAGAFATAFFLVIVSQVAAGDPVTPTTPVVAAEPDPGTLHLQTPSTVVTDGGSNLRLPPGYFLPEPEYKRQDALLKSLGDDKTNLTAQNISLRASTSGWQPGWRTLAAALVTGLVAGLYVDHRFF